LFGISAIPAVSATQTPPHVPKFTFLHDVFYPVILQDYAARYRPEHESSDPDRTAAMPWRIPFRTRDTKEVSAFRAMRPRDFRLDIEHKESKVYRER
jgi:hypothetical protein